MSLLVRSTVLYRANQCLGPQRKDIFNVTFLNCRFNDVLANNLCFNAGHKNFCKSNGHFCTHGCTMDFKVVPSIELEKIFFENECEHVNM